MSESGSPTPSQIMNSSQSSEGSSIGGYIVVDKCDENLQNSHSGEDGKPDEIPAKSESLVQAGSIPQDELVERVHNLTKENEELKGVLLQNNKLLEEYFQDLASMQKTQKQTNESLRKGYDHAKEVVKKLRERNATLKTELKNEQNKNLQLEEQLSKVKDIKQNGPSLQNDNVMPGDKDNPSQVQSLNEVIKRLESEKDTLEMNNSKLQEHISCLKAMREAEPNTETDECETLISLESLTSDIQTSPEVLQENYKKLETEKEILMVDLERIKIENEQKQQQCSQLEEERDKLLQKLADIEQRQVVKEDIKPEIIDTQAAVTASEQVTGLCQQLEVQTEALSSLKEELDALRQENEILKKTAEELKQGKETTENEDIETMKQQLQNYQEKERENREAAGKQAALQAELTKETAKLKQQLETEKEAVGKLRADLEKLIQEKDGYKRKIEELEMHPEESKESGDEAFEVPRDSHQKDKLIERLKAQNIKYITREGDVLNRENAVLEKEEGHKQLIEEKKRLELQLAEALKEKEALLQERREQEEQTQSLQRQLSSVSDELSETHEREVNQLKEELQNTNTAMATVLTSGEELKNNVTQLMNKNENLFGECEKLKAEYSQKEEEVQSLKKQLSDVSSELNETRECEVNLKEELARNSEALTTAEATMESLKVQVTQLIQENQFLAAELERMKDDYTQQENMYQDHLHKITEDSESQRVKRDEIIKALRKQVSAFEVELQNARVQLEADGTVHQQLREEHERMVTEYQELLQAYQTTRDANKQREKEEYMARTALESHTKKLEDELKRADALLGKLKEDIGLQEEEVNNLRQDSYDLKQLQERLHVLEAQLDVYRRDFQVEREAREKQHEEILRLRADNQHYQDEIDQRNDRGMAELQRRHGSFVPEPRDVQQQQQQEQPRGWFDGMLPMFARGPGDPSAVPNPEGEMGNPGRAQMGGDQQEQRAPAAEEEDWQCPTCRRVFANFDILQVHAVECIGTQAQPAPAYEVQNQCPSCMEVFPDYDTLAIHVEECLDQHQ